MANPLDRTWYSTLVDDDGSGTTGTIWNKAAVDALLDSVDAALATVVDKTGGPGLNQVALFQDADTLKSTPNIVADPNGAIALISDNYPYLGFSDRSQPANGKTFHIVNSSGVIHFLALNDAGVPIGASLQISRTGRLYLNSGHLSFPGTQNPSTDPYTLDDYREQPFTPYLTGSTGASGQTYTQQSALATKIGSLVVCKGAITIANVGTYNANSVIQIAGFPFVSRAVTHMTVGSVVFNALATPGGPMGLYMTGARVTADLIYLPAGGNVDWNYVAPTQLKTGTVLNFELSYHTA